MGSPSGGRRLTAPPSSGGACARLLIWPSTLAPCPARLTNGRQVTPSPVGAVLGKQFLPFVLWSEEGTGQIKMFCRAWMRVLLLDPVLPVAAASNIHLPLHKGLLATWATHPLVLLSAIVPLPFIALTFSNDRTRQLIPICISHSLSFIGLSISTLTSGCESLRNEWMSSQPPKRNSSSAPCQWTQGPGPRIQDPTRRVQQTMLPTMKLSAE